MNVFLSRWAKLYSNLTPAETALEPAVASLGTRYRVQHPLWALHLFPDFALLDHRLILEVDDPGHHTPKGREKDAARSLRLAQNGWRVVRCTNAEAIEDPFGAVDRMMKAAGLDLRTRNPSTPTLVGESPTPSDVPHPSATGPVDGPALHRPEDGNDGGRRRRGSGRRGRRQAQAVAKGPSSASS